MKRASFLILPAVAVLYQGCGATPESAADDAEVAPSRFLVVHSPQETDLTERLGRLEFLDRGDRPDVRFEPAGEAVPSPGEGEVLVLAGSPDRFPHLREALSAYPWNSEGDGFEFGGERYEDPRASLIIVSPVPGRPWLVASDNEEVLFWTVIRLTHRRRPIEGHYRVTTGRDDLVRRGYFRRGGPPFRIDPSRELDERRERQQFYDSLTRMGPETGAAIEILARGDAKPGVSPVARITEMARQVGLRPGARAILYTDPVIKGRYTGDASEGHLDPDSRTVHLLAEPIHEREWALALARLAATDRLGGHARPWLIEGWARRSLGDRWIADQQSLSAAFLAGGVLPTLDELLSGTADSDQPSTIFGPAACSFLHFLSHRVGEPRAREIAVSGDPALLLETAGGKASLERDWRESLPDPPPLSRVSRAPSAFMKGVNLAMLNRIDLGYQSSGCGEVLEKLSDMGVDWIAVTPFGFTRGTDRPVIHMVLRGLHAETDASMRHVMHMARKSGIRVLYKPHLWVSHGDWVGEIAMKNDGDWKEWFLDYRRFAVHHALLAAEGGAEVFCVANELSATTHRGEDWRRVIAAVRRVFPGKIVFSANWGTDLDLLGFADALDLVGVSAYYPLSSSSEATDEDLLDGVTAMRNKLEKMSRRWRKKILLTEIGYPALPHPWIRPYEERRGVSDPEAQARCYRAVLQGLAGSEWLAGLFWWKVESSPGHGGPEDGSFSFMAKPAERVVRSAWKDSL